MLSYKWQLRTDAWLRFFCRPVKDFIESLADWFLHRDAVSKIASDSCDFEDYLLRLMNEYDKPVQHDILRLFVHFSEDFLRATYEICLVDRVHCLIDVGSALTKEEVADLLWRLQGDLIDKEVYPFGKEFPTLRNFVIGIRNITLHGGLERFHDAKLTYEILKECCMTFGIPRAVVNELWNAVDMTMTESIPLAERILTFERLNRLIDAVADREP